MFQTVPLAFDDPAFLGRDVEVWRVDLDASREPPDAATAVLDDAERARLGRFHRVGDRARFAFLRAALRQHLGDRLGRAARDVPIRIDAHGRPHLPDDRIRFSLAHSGDHGLVALSATTPVGVDLERSQAHDRLDALADLILAPSERSVWRSEQADRRSRLFLRVWTAKEALLKAAGTGLLTDPRAVAVLGEGEDFAVCGAPERLGFDPADAVVRTLAAPPGYAAALALLGSGERGASSRS